MNYVVLALVPSRKASKYYLKVEEGFLETRHVCCGDETGECAGVGGDLAGIDLGEWTLAGEDVAGGDDTNGGSTGVGTNIGACTAGGKVPGPIAGAALEG